MSEKEESEKKGEDIVKSKLENDKNNNNDNNDDVKKVELNEDEEEDDKKKLQPLKIKCQQLPIVYQAQKTKSGKDDRFVLSTTKVDTEQKKQQ